LVVVVLFFFLFLFLLLRGSKGLCSVERGEGAGGLLGFQGPDGGQLAT
jgi:hypothetical protein